MDDFIYLLIYFAGGGGSKFWISTFGYFSAKMSILGYIVFVDFFFF